MYLLANLLTFPTRSPSVTVAGTEAGSHDITLLAALVSFHWNYDTVLLSLSRMTQSATLKRIAVIRILHSAQSGPSQLMPQFRERRAAVRFVFLAVYAGGSAVNSWIRCTWCRELSCHRWWIHTDAKRLCFLFRPACKPNCLSRR